MRYDADVIRRYTASFVLSGWYRVFLEKYKATPLGTGVKASRFSSPTGDYTMLYAAQTLAAAVTEGVIRDRFELTEADRRLTETELEGYVVAPIATLYPVTLIDLTTPQNLFKMGLPHDIIGASDHRFGQAFSAVAHADPSIDGILYRSRFIGDTCAALYHRATLKLKKPRKRAVINLVRDPTLVSALSVLDIKVVAKL